MALESEKMGQPTFSLSKTQPARVPVKVVSKDPVDVGKTSGKPPLAEEL